MIQTVTITSQGQISIPSSIRKRLKLKIPSKAYLRVLEDKIILEPAKDFLDLGGSLSHKRMKGRSLDEIQKLENKAISKAMIDNYAKK